MPGSSSGSLLGWNDWGGRHFQAPTEAHPIVQAWGEEGTGGTRATRVSSRRQRGRGIGVRVVGGTTLWDGSILQTSLHSEAFPSHACVITPHPAPPHPPRKLSEHLIPAGRAPQGGLCNDRAPRPKGLLRVTSIQLWPPTSIKDPITQRLMMCFGEKELFSHWKLIVIPSHCSVSKTVLQSTKDAGLDLKQSNIFGLAWSIWCCLTGNPSQVNSVNLLVNRRMKSLAYLIQEWAGPQLNVEFQVLPIFPQSRTAPTWLPFKLPRQNPSQSTPLPPPSLPLPN